MKKFLSVAALGVAAGAFALASCGNDNQKTTETTAPTTETTTSTPTTTTQGATSADKLLQNLIFDKDGSAVTEDLQLLAYLASGETQVQVKWESDSNLITIATEVASGKDYFVATVARPEEETEVVTLTASITFEGNTATKTFTVSVNPYTVDDAIDAYEFAQRNATVYEDFNLDTTFKFNNQDVAISWEIPANSTAYLALAEDGKSVVVTPQDERTKAAIKATFTYKGETSSITYRFNIYHERTPMELLHAFYDETGSESYTLKGYVAHKEFFDPAYGNGYLYIVDQTLQGGYYVYRAYCTQEVWDSLEIGTPVEIPACMSTLYGGLIEVAQNKDNIVSVTDGLPALTTEQLELITKGFAADDLVVLNSFNADDSIKYYTGARVNLTSWKVAELGDGTAKNGGVLVTLQKDDATIKVMISKYATTLDGDVAKAAVTQASALKVGDYVNVTGILNNYDSEYCIYVSDATTFTKTTADENASLVKTKNLLDPINDVLNHIPGALTEVMQLDTAAVAVADGVTFAVSVDNEEIATWNDKVLTLTPQVDEKYINVTVTATDGTYTITKKASVYTKLTTAAEKVAEEKAAFALDYDEFGVYELPTEGATYSDVQITYALAATEFAEYNSTDSELTIHSVDEDTTITLTVTFTVGDETDTKEVVLTIKNKPRYATDNVAVTAPEEDKVYFLGLNQEGLGEVIYATGAISSNRLATTNAQYNAILVTVEKIEDAYAIKLANGKYVSLTSAGKLNLADEAFAWTYDADHTAWVGVVGEKTYFMGTYSTYNTISASDASQYIEKSGQYKAQLYLAESLTKTREEKLEFEFAQTRAKISPTVDSKATITLPTVGSVFEDVKAVYAKVDPNAPAEVNGGEITFGSVGTATKVYFTVTLTCGDKTMTETFYFEVQPVEFKDVTAAVDGIKENDTIYVRGIVTEIGSNFAWISDGTTDFEIYGTLDTSEGNLKYTDLSIGDIIAVSGKYTLYNGTVHEVSGTGVIYKKLDIEKTDAQKVAVTVRELAGFRDIASNVVDQQLATAGTTFNTVGINWDVKGTSTTTDITDNKMSITQGAREEVTVEATITLNEVEVKKEFKFTVYEAGVVFAYSTATTETKANAEGINLTTILALDPTVFTVTYTKGESGTNETAFRTDGVRMYANKGKVGNSLTFTAATGYKIDWVMIQFNTANDGTYAVVKAGDNTKTATDGVYTINNGSFELIDDNTNATKNTQVRFTQIVIHYSVEE